MAHVVKKRFLFIHFLILGLESVYRNLRMEADRMDDIEATWLPIELNPPERIARFGPIARNHSLKFGFVARSRVRALEKSGKRFDAAFFNHILPALFLNDFRRRVPSVDALDVTPIQMLRYGEIYYTSVRRYSMGPVRRAKSWYLAHVYSSAAHLLPCSEFVKSSLLNDYGMDGEKIHVVPPGIDLSIWPGRPSGDSGVADLKNRMQVLFVGGDFWRKGGDLLARIAGREEFRDCDFHFVTRSFEGPVGGNIFVHDNLPPNSKPLVDLYKNADVFVLPTRADVYSIAGLEAMAMGLPIIITNVGGIGEIVHDGVHGFLIPPNDEDAIADRLRELLSNVELRRKLGSNGRKRVESQFDLRTYARTIVQYLQLAADQK